MAPLSGIDRRRGHAIYELSFTFIRLEKKRK